MKMKLNVGYAAIFSTYWMTYGAFCSFASAYLLNIDYSNAEIGIIIAVGSIISALIQPVLADISDRSQKLSAIEVSEICLVVLMALTVLQIIIGRRSLILCIIVACITAGILSLQPLFNSLSGKFEASGNGVNFGACRAMGSFAYAALCAILGTFVEKAGSSILPKTSLVLMILTVIAIAATGRIFKRASGEVNTKGDERPSTNLSSPTEEDINLLEFLKRNKLFIVLNVGIIFVYFSLAITNNFTLQITESVGGNVEDSGRILSVMAALEIPPLFLFAKINQKVTCEKLIVFGSVMYVAKTAVLYIAENVMMLYVAQIFHMMCFAILLTAMVKFIDEMMARGEAVKGQALFIMCVTIANVLGSIFGGAILDTAGPKTLLLLTLISTVVGTAIIAVSVNLLSKRKKMLVI